MVELNWQLQSTGIAFSKSRGLIFNQFSRKVRWKNLGSLLPPPPKQLPNIGSTNSQIILALNLTFNGNCHPNSAFQTTAKYWQYQFPGNVGTQFYHYIASQIFPSFPLPNIGSTNFQVMLALNFTTNIATEYHHPNITC